MTDTETQHRRLPRGRTAAIAAALGLLVVGGGAGALAVEATRPSVTMVPATPIAIRTLTDNAIVTIRGRVAEVYGNKFILADATGRALVETGRAGEDGTLVAVGQPVTVQGSFRHGFLHAAFLVGADGKVAALGPVGGPRDGHGGPGRHGPGGRSHGGPDRDGPDGGPDGASDSPPPPAASQNAAPPAEPGA